jgi:hypothetical protein
MVTTTLPNYNPNPNLTFWPTGWLGISLIGWVWDLPFGLCLKIKISSFWFNVIFYNIKNRSKFLIYFVNKKKSTVMQASVLNQSSCVIPSPIWYSKISRLSNLFWMAAKANWLFIKCNEIALWTKMTFHTLGLQSIECI